MSNVVLLESDEIFDDWYTCTNCNKCNTILKQHIYCPHCGVKLEFD